MMWNGIWPHRLTVLVVQILAMLRNGYSERSESQMDSYYSCFGFVDVCMHPSIPPSIHAIQTFVSFPLTASWTNCVFFWMHQLDGFSISPCSPMNADISYNIALHGSWNEWCLVDRKGTAFGRDSWQNHGAISNKIVGQINRSQVDTFRNWPCTNCRTCPLDIKYAICWM